METLYPKATVARYRHSLRHDGHCDAAQRKRCAVAEDIAQMASSTGSTVRSRIPEMREKYIRSGATAGRLAHAIAYAEEFARWHEASGLSLAPDCPHEDTTSEHAAPETPAQVFAARVRTALVRREATADEAGERAGMRPWLLDYLLRACGEVGADAGWRVHVPRLASSLGVDPEWLLGKTDEAGWRDVRPFERRSTTTRPRRGDRARYDTMVYEERVLRERLDALHQRRLQLGEKLGIRPEQEETK